MEAIIIIAWLISILSWKNVVFSPQTCFHFKPGVLNNIPFLLVGIIYAKNHSDYRGNSRFRSCLQ